MLIKKVIPSGYCKGVVRAIDIAKKTRLQYPDSPIYVLGNIVHNRYVSAALKSLDIITLPCTISKEDEISGLNQGVLLLTAHGTSPLIKRQALDKGLIVVDAACEDVLSTQSIIREKISENYKVFYVGKHNHPEAEAVCALSPDIVLISEEKDIPLNIEQKIFVTNQTTMSVFDIRNIFSLIQSLYPQAQFEKEICNATTMRQNAIMNLKDCDVLVVVGDPSSNNSINLKRIGLDSGIRKVVMVEHAGQLMAEDYQPNDIVYVTAGASTPAYLQNQVIETLKKYAETGILPETSVDISAIL